MNERPSSFEFAVLKVFHSLYGDTCNFPDPNEVSIVERSNTGAGRYVKLESSIQVAMPDGYLDMGGRYIQMEGVPNGLMATVAITKGRIDVLEIAVYGNTSWDGQEKSWSIK
jgi:hypothetical protein